VEDLNFNAKFEMKANKTQNMHGLIAWFDVYFSHCHIPICLSTSPLKEETHWKQTIFYIDGYQHL
jgi:protein arginine N-methyltransferase 1